jgi:hypothetical protein
MNYGRTISTVQKTSALALLAFFASSTLASADPLNARGIPDDQWRYTVTMDAFLPTSTTGTSVIAGGETDVDLDLQDVFEVLNIAVSGRAEAWRGDFGLVADGYYMNLGGDETFTGPGGMVTASVDIEVEQAWLDLLGAYRVARGAWDDAGRLYSVDVQAGVRYNYLKQKVKAGLATDLIPGGSIQNTLGGSENWWEPVVGVRGAMQLADRWTLGARADFGGFGVNGDDLQWKALVGADYRPWENASLKFGWQVYGIDYSTIRSDGEFTYDVVQTGPYMGLTFGF